ncbi:phosphoribosylglycinamide formyltransferase [Oceanicoccus sp. KOV_DT_Chl]|uniref:phosphoribosylglycinamide formyltransferase n=1 Tax=Oceanicoccus sp. KOV_DT_Chl TaxID=1904639 RepID=UPI000C7AFBE7|nr:phosphoribosylglycinamide formyltransferase [Oceanicoccus sp. KOV_DT_Chl]
MANSSSGTSVKCRLVILISGSGSNLQSFIDAAISGDLNADIAAVVCNRPGAYGLERAANAGIATELIDHTLYDSRDSFDAELVQRIDRFTPDLIILAGFMRILTPSFVQHYHGRLLNIHPSLLPKYPGLHTHQRALDAGDDKAGATVHFVTEQLDGGPAIIQASIDISEQDTADDIAKRVLVQEHQIYPLAAQWFAEGRLTLRDNRALLDNEELSTGGFQYTKP